MVRVPCNIQGLWSPIPLRLLFIEPEKLNIGYLDALRGLLWTQILGSLTEGIQNRITKFWKQNALYSSISLSLYMPHMAAQNEFKGTPLPKCAQPPQKAPTLRLDKTCCHCVARVGRLPPFQLLWSPSKRPGAGLADPPPCRTGPQGRRGRFGCKLEALSPLAFTGLLFWLF